MSSTLLPPPPTPSTRFGHDVREACARIHSWSRFLAIVGIVSVLFSAVVAFGLWVSADDATLMAIALLVVASAVVTLVPTIRMFGMSRAFGAVAFPATAGALVEPLRRLRSVLMWFVILGAVGQAIVLGAAIVTLVIPGVMETLGADKPSKTAVGMREVALAIDEYARRHHVWPEANDYSQLQERLAIEGADRALPLTDAWGKPFHYVLESTYRGPKYTLMSLGADGVRQELDSEGTPGSSTPRPDDRDLVIESGVFVEGPDEFLGIVHEEPGK